MGIVYEADDERLGRKVAIKVLQTGPTSAERKRRFAQEAHAASALNHPNIITIHDIDTADAGDFIVMELVDGLPLNRLPQDGPMPIDRAVDYAVQIASALAASHAADIVHRDLKPANVMVTHEGRIKVLDFGLSKWTAEPTPAADAVTVTAAPHTSAGAILGTSGYMSPEQALGQPVDARSDVFSFGVVLYELLAGQRAFGIESDWSAMKALVHDQPKPLRDIRPDVPDPVVRRTVSGKRSNAPLCLGG
jgi:eukaryotic-like serine/threonine-protein kinase